MKKVLLLVDLVKGFGEDGYDEKMYCKNVENIKNNLKTLVEYADKNDIFVVYCCDAHHKEDYELKKNGGPWEEHCMENTESSEIVSWLPSNNVLNVTKNMHDDSMPSNVKALRIDKRAYSGFSSGALEILLKHLKTEEVYIAGLVTSICVQHTAADAFFRGYKLNIIENGCVDTTDEKHKNAIEYMKCNYSADILKIEEMRLNGAV